MASSHQSGRPESCQTIPAGISSANKVAAKTKRLFLSFSNSAAIKSSNAHTPCDLFEMIFQRILTAHDGRHLYA